MGKPHYDPYYHVCDPCGGEAPIYDPETNMCKACPSTQQYNKTSGRCYSSSSGFEPTIVAPVPQTNYSQTTN